MSILMDALKQQVEPATAVGGRQQGNGWRNLALLLGFCLAVLLGVALASWWQQTNQKTNDASIEVAVSNDQQAEPELASSTSIAAALQSAESVAATPALPEQEQFKAEPKIVSVTAPAAESQASQTSEQKEQAALPEVEVSDELRQRFASAMAASDVDNRQSRSVVRGNSAPAKDISELPLLMQQQIPSLRFEAHVYATQSSQRWVKVNGKSLQEGQWITADIRLSEITPHFVLLQMGDELFSMPALTDYN
ncbi:general secretion pathway protein GspB [Arsukibacterium indicum]|uniref:General secretion pathway protein GspB n=1 Tax=Arsukibacterium indicum TaxID=2848612 RepID=A0ABS6MJH5_9GAMM|nr:general secretion pathway protein GspB [Arsukibacterium indicum]MBV2128977.1 general secretion pathway protein GspB [Arsukibacterium indicum]